MQYNDTGARRRKIISYSFAYHLLREKKKPSPVTSLSCPLSRRHTSCPGEIPISENTVAATLQFSKEEEKGKTNKRTRPGICSAAMTALPRAGDILCNESDDTTAFRILGTFPLTATVAARRMIRAWLSK